MRALHLDYERVGRPSATGYGLLLAGLIGALVVLAQYRGVLQQTEAYQEITRKYQGESRTRSAPARALDPKETKAQEERLVAARAVIDQLALPWGALLSALESVEDEDVALLQVSPEADKRQLKLLAEAKDLAAMLRYHKLLEQSDILREVALVDHQIQEQDPDKPVRFNITAQWVLNRNAYQ